MLYLEEKTRERLLQEAQPVANLDILFAPPAVDAYGGTEFLEFAVDDALAELARQLPADQQLPQSCLVAVSGQHLGTIADHQPAQLADGAEMVLIAPVAGG